MKVTVAQRPLVTGNSPNTASLAAAFLAGVGKAGSGDVFDKLSIALEKNFKAYQWNGDKQQTVSYILDCFLKDAPSLDAVPVTLTYLVDCMHNGKPTTKEVTLVVTNNALQLLTPDSNPAAFVVLATYNSDTDYAKLIKEVDTQVLCHNYDDYTKAMPSTTSNTSIKRALIDYLHQQPDLKGFSVRKIADEIYHKLVAHVAKHPIPPVGVNLTITLDLEAKTLVGVRKKKFTLPQMKLTPTTLSIQKKCSPYIVDNILCRHNNDFSSFMMHSTDSLNQITSATSVEQKSARSKAERIKSQAYAVTKLILIAKDKAILGSKNARLKDCIIQRKGQAPGFDPNKYKLTTEEEKLAMMIQKDIFNFLLSLNPDKLTSSDKSAIMSITYAKDKSYVKKKLNHDVRVNPKFATPVSINFNASSSELTVSVPTFTLDKYDFSNEFSLLDYDSPDEFREVMNQLSMLVDDDNIDIAMKTSNVNDYVKFTKPNPLTTPPPTPLPTPTPTPPPTPTPTPPPTPTPTPPPTPTPTPPPTPTPTPPPTPMPTPPPTPMPTPPPTPTPPVKKLNIPRLKNMINWPYTQQDALKKVQTVFNKMVPFAGMNANSIDTMGLQLELKLSGLLTSLRNIDKLTDDTQKQKVIDEIHQCLNDMKPLDNILHGHLTANNENPLFGLRTIYRALISEYMSFNP